MYILYKSTYNGNFFYPWHSIKFFDVLSSVAKAVSSVSQGH